jgi:hypothetical protein
VDDEGVDINSNEVLDAEGGLGLVESLVLRNIGFMHSEEESRSDETESGRWKEKDPREGKLKVPRVFMVYMDNNGYELGQGYFSMK